MCFVDLDRAFDKVPRKVLEWAMRKDRIPNVLGGSVINVYECTRTGFIVNSLLYEEFGGKVKMHQVTDFFCSSGRCCN